MAYKDNTTPVSLGSVVTMFVRSAIGGPLLGVALGLLSSIWLRRVIRD
jgi:NhaP-type Na+/H+ or K+/H+ antiporter